MAVTNRQARYAGANQRPLVGGPSLDVAQLDVELPQLRAGRGRDLMPDLIPQFYFRAMRIPDLYAGRDYLMSVFTDDGWGGLNSSGTRVVSLTEPGDYRIEIAGCSDRLTGHTSALFRVRRPFPVVPVALVAVFVLLAVLAALFLLPK